MRISIIQSSYIPWRGFFDLIGRCDRHVIFDRAQFVTRHWHNRNRIKTANGPIWLTVPVVTKGRRAQPIDAVAIAGDWAERHWRSIATAYARAPFFDAYAPRLCAAYERAGRETLLTAVNEVFLRELADIFGLTTTIVRDTAYPAAGRRTARLLAIAQAAGAARYLSGPSARAYLDEDLLMRHGVATEWMDYGGYPDYPQLHGAFDPHVSALDVLFMLGPQARDAMRATGGEGTA